MIDCKYIMHKMFPFCLYCPLLKPVICNLFDCFLNGECNSLAWPSFTDIILILQKLWQFSSRHKRRQSQLFRTVYTTTVIITKVLSRKSTSWSDNWWVVCLSRLSDFISVGECLCMCSVSQFGSPPVESHYGEYSTHSTHRKTSLSIHRHTNTRFWCSIPFSRSLSYHFSKWPAYRHDKVVSGWTSIRSVSDSLDDTLGQLRGDMRCYCIVQNERLKRLAKEDIQHNVLINIVHFGIKLPFSSSKVG